MQRAVYLARSQPTSTTLLQSMCARSAETLSAAPSRARITHADRTVRWSDFAMSWFDNDDNRRHHDPQDFGPGPELQFDAEAYRLRIEHRHRI